MSATIQTPQQTGRPGEPDAALTCWRSPEHEWRTTGVACSVSASALPTAVVEATAESARPVLAVLPFDQSGPAVLVTPHGQPQDSGPAGAASTDGAPGKVGMRATWVQESRGRYAAAVRDALELIEDGVFEKAVLARKVDLHADEPLEPGAAFAALVQAYPGIYGFCVPMPTSGALIGASPELLIAKHSMTIRSHPLAGSAPRSLDPTRDEESSRALLASEKDNREHQYVVQAIADVLAPYCRELHVPKQPALVATRTVWHLGTYIEGQLREEVSSLELARALHPTPAVGGTPRGAALEHIARLEDFDRDYYAGAVGWTDAAGDGEWAVAIRCAQVDGQQVRAYAGAGIVAGSQPESEVVETANKMRAVLDVIGQVRSE